jgi:hypothetical protein
MYISPNAYMRKITRVIPELGSSASLNMEHNIYFSKRKEVGNVEVRLLALPM